MPQSSAQARAHLSRRLRVQLCLFGLIFLVMHGVLAYNVAGGS